MVSEETCQKNVLLEINSASHQLVTYPIRNETLLVGNFVYFRFKVFGKSHDKDD